MFWIISPARFGATSSAMSSTLPRRMTARRFEVLTAALDKISERQQASAGNVVALILSERNSAPHSMVMTRLFPPLLKVLCF